VALAERLPAKSRAQGGQQDGRRHRRLHTSRGEHRDRLMLTSGICAASRRRRFDEILGRPANSLSHIADILRARTATISTLQAEYLFAAGAAGMHVVQIEDIAAYAEYSGPTRTRQLLLTIS